MLWDVNHASYQAKLLCIESDQDLATPHTLASDQ